MKLIEKIGIEKAAQLIDVSEYTIRRALRGIVKLTPLQTRILTEYESKHMRTVEDKKTCQKCGTDKYIYKTGLCRACRARQTYHEKVERLSKVTGIKCDVCKVEIIYPKINYCSKKCANQARRERRKGERV